MDAPIRRVETTHADEITRTAAGSVQWFLEHRHKDGTHPITTNNKLSFFICGEEAFRDIAAEIAKAEESIDLCCWGFDPGMELVRDGNLWPRGPTFGDLLIEAGRRGVQVRLLVWYDMPGSRLMKNMPGYSHDLSSWMHFEDRHIAQGMSARRSLAWANAMNQGRKVFDAKFGNKGLFIHSIGFPLDRLSLHAAARQEYCYNWYRAALAGKLRNVSVRTRGSSSTANESSLAREQIRPDFVERPFLTKGSTHHQKPILIDFSFEEGTKAVGYVMGLNSVTGYWDTCKHRVDDLRRERGGTKEANERVHEKASEFGFTTLQPYHDYACRIDAGGALIALHKNFSDAWRRAGPATERKRPQQLRVPKHLQRKAMPGDCRAQIVRTDPLDQDQTIKELYFHAADQAANAIGYMYIENQYFQYEEWCQRLLATRRKVVAQWKKNSQKIGRPLEQMPILHIFIVIPVPEREQMIPRTYDALATLGQHEAMTGQQEQIDAFNELNMSFGSVPQTAGISKLLQPDVITHANSIHKPSLQQLRDEFGVRVSVAMLNSCGMRDGKFIYREIYNHSKIMIIDDSLTTLGSANLNQRSMTVDSEINVVTDNASLARQLRARIMGIHSGGSLTGGNGTRADISDTFDRWERLANANYSKRSLDSADSDLKYLSGFLLSFRDYRDSIVRLA